MVYIPSLGDPLNQITMHQRWGQRMGKWPLHQSLSMIIMPTHSAKPTGVWWALDIWYSLPIDGVVLVFSVIDGLCLTSH